MADDEQPRSASGKKNGYEIPEWMQADSTIYDYVAAEPTIAIEMARYTASHPYAPRADGHGALTDPQDDEKAFLHLLIQAAFYRDARTLDEWRAYAQSYPNVALTEAQTSYLDSPDVKVRSHYLRGALVKLLELIGAPAPMIADADSILGLKSPRAADARARVQASLIDNPEAGIRQLGRDNRYDPGQITKDLKSGKLIRPRSKIGGDG